MGGQTATGSTLDSTTNSLGGLGQLSSPVGAHSLPRKVGAARPPRPSLEGWKERAQSSPALGRAQQAVPGILCGPITCHGSWPSQRTVADSALGTPLARPAWQQEDESQRPRRCRSRAMRLQLCPHAPPLLAGGWLDSHRDTGSSSDAGILQGTMGSTGDAAQILGREGSYLPLPAIV